MLRARFEATPAPEGAFVLAVIEGPDRGRTFVLDGSAPALLGTGTTSTVRLDDREVSRRHASIDVVGDRLRVADLGSTNGTQIDGVGVEDAWLRSGQTLRVGGTTLRVTHDAAAPGASLSLETSFGRVIGASTEMRRLYPFFERMAASSVVAILEGETGTGKEALAESLHERGPRAAGPFVVFDCTAVPPTLVESELFGHERGAFTGAAAARRGVFEQAHGGTLLIDEIGDLDAALQPKLLRAIERAEIRRVGGEQSIEVDVRVLAATRRDLDREVMAGRFRDDLFHRLAVARIELPPLRRRKGDVGVLAAHFAAELGGPGVELPPELLVRWQDAPWPGNVRELRNAVTRHLVFGEASEIDPYRAAAERGAAEVPPDGDFLDRIIAEGALLTEARQRVVEEFERRYVHRALERSGANVTHAAAQSGVPRRYFQILKARTGQ